jgi:hypothetical protein
MSQRRTHSRLQTSGGVVPSGLIALEHGLTCAVQGSPTSDQRDARYLYGYDSLSVWIRRVVRSEVTHGFDRSFPTRVAGTDEPRGPRRLYRCYDQFRGIIPLPRRLSRLQARDAVMLRRYAGGNEIRGYPGSRPLQRRRNDRPLFIAPHPLKGPPIVAASSLPLDLLQHFTGAERPDKIVGCILIDDVADKGKNRSGSRNVPAGAIMRKHRVTH